MPQPSSPPTGAAAVAGGATVVVGTAATAGAAAAGAGASTAGIAGVGVAAAAIMSSFIAFLAALRERHARWLAAQLAARAGAPADIAQVLADEMRFENEFARNSADRVASQLPAALAIKAPAERKAAVAKILDAEERYAGQRAEAMFARAIGALQRDRLRRESPLGAYWEIGHARDHTKGCLFMHGKFWPWAVLDRVHPPRHYGCTSGLRSFADAVSSGLMTPGDVPETAAAVRAAAGVVMEAEDADAVMAEVLVRDRLVEQGVSPAALAQIPFEGVVVEGFDPLEPRGAHGRWIRGVAAALKRGEQATIKPEHAPALIDALADGSPSALHHLQVEGRPNLFRAHARELARVDMPQIPKQHLPGFMDFLRERRIGATVEQVAPSSLMATQNQVNGAAVAALVKGWDPARGGMMMISREGHVLDGHHRWAAAALHELSNPNSRVQVLRFSAGTDRILALMRDYNRLVGQQSREFGRPGVPKVAA